MVYKIIEEIDFHLQATQLLVDSRSNPNHKQPKLMQMIASVAYPPTFVPTKINGQIFPSYRPFIFGLTDG